MKQLKLCALLAGAGILLMGFLSSCKTDTTDLDTRLRVLETQWADLEATLDKAVAKGLYITSSSWSAGRDLYTIVLSSGDTVEIPIVSGGTTVTVDIKDGIAVITVDGTPYEIPLGSAISSLVYQPEYEDGVVLLGNDGARVRFLATPTPDAAALASARIDFVDIYGAKARTRVATNELIVVDGKPSLSNGYIEVPIKGIQAAADTTYFAAMQMTLAGTTISSNYFTVKTTADFFFKTEDINESIKPKASFEAVADDLGGYTVTLDGMLLIGQYKFQEMFEGVPAGATFGIAAVDKQTNGDARNKHAMLTRSMAADGTFEFAERPGTTFGKEGFQIVVKNGYTVIAKTFVKIIDPLAAVTDWTGGLAKSPDAEFGARYKGFKPGVNELDFPKSLLSWGPEGPNEKDWEIIHGGTGGIEGREGFFAKWPEFSVKAGDDVLVQNNGERLVNGTSEKVKKLLTKSEGVYFYIKGICIDIPEKFDLNTDGDNDPKTNPFTYVKADGTSVVGGEGDKRIRDIGGPNYPDVKDGYGWSTKYTWDRVASFGVTMSKEGVIRTTTAYGGHGMRLTVGASFEWFYGSKRLGANGGEFGFFFINRRWFDKGAKVTFPQGL